MLNIIKKKKLAETHPEIALEWHPTLNDELAPNDVTAGSNKKVWWNCEKGHSYKAKICHRTAGSRCPYCFGKRLSYERSLEHKYPKLAKELHPAKNGSLIASQIHASSRKKLYWVCSKDTSHEWESTVDNRTKGNGCPYCKNKKIDKSNSLESVNPRLASEWCDEKNGALKPSAVAPFSNKKVAWKCKKNHLWYAPISRRSGGTGCPYCAGIFVADETALVAVHPELAIQWHPTKNGNRSPFELTAGSNKKVWWQCPRDGRHEWEATVANRVMGRDCPYCNSGWTIENIRVFVQSLLPYVDTLTPAGLYILFQQTGLSNISKMSKGSSFIQALKTGKFPKEELEKFAAGEPSLVDEFVSDSDLTLEDNLLASENNVSELSVTDSAEVLPTVETKDILATLDSKLISNADAETIDFFIKEAASRIWQHAFLDEIEAINQLKQYNSNGIYPEEVKRLFLTEYAGAKELVIPNGYSFHDKPNLMQLYTAYLVKSRKRIGNWSGTGAGKTLSAILASRVIDAQLTVICCPNNVIDNWARNISGIFPDSSIYIKDTEFEKTTEQSKPKYLIFNYEFFQQTNPSDKLKILLAAHQIDFIIIDEIHFSRQRTQQASNRKQNISWLLSEAAIKNPNLHVLGMSATPVINNLFEGKTLIELITGLRHDDLATQSTVSNCVSLFKKFVTYGIRWVPQYACSIKLTVEEIDCSSVLNELKQQCITAHIADLEAVLTKSKLPFILNNLKRKTIIYTHYKKRILSMLQEAMEQNGWKVTFFTGEHKEGLDAFINGDADILIATCCVGTGIDQLQTVCARLIVNSLPWTHAEFEQLKGRIYRQGQPSSQVEIMVPLTFAIINGERWSWCDSRWKRIQFKKSIADAAVDGVIPEGQLRSPEQAHKDIMEWLRRLEAGEINTIERKKISDSRSAENNSKSLRKIGDLSKLNQSINLETSDQTHNRFNANPVDWYNYHAIYAKTRQVWEVVPYKEAIKWATERPHMIIGDFGCGEAFLAQELKNKVYSFDHIAINENVIACDMKSVPIADNTLDAAIFSLSLMGRNFIDYLREARRSLKLDGHLWIAEPTSRIQNIELFKELLERLGFDIRVIHQKWDFTFIEALKSDREINETVIQTLNSHDILA